MTFLPASLPSTKSACYCPFLVQFLFHGIAAQAQAQAEQTVSPQAPTVDPKLDHQYAILLEVEGNISANHASLVARLNSQDSEVELIIQAAIGFNKTLNQLVEENETLRNRQAAAAVLQVTQFLMVILYFLVIGIVYLVKCFKVQQAKQLEQNLQEMEERLQERKKQEEVCRQTTKVLLFTLLVQQMQQSQGAAQHSW